MRRSLPRLRALVAAGALPVWLLAAGFACEPRPRIVSPADLSPLAADGTAAVQIDFGSPLGEAAVVRIRLLAGIDAPPPRILDVTAEFLPGDVGSFAGLRTVEAELGPGDGIAEGRNTLFVSIDRDGVGGAEATVTSTFSWEPRLDLTNADRCDVLDAGHCLFPFPNDFFTVADETMDTGRRVNFARDAMPDNRFGVHMDPTEWNRSDGFSPGAMLTLLIPGVDLARTGAARITDLARSLDADAPFVILNARTLERHLFWAERDSAALTDARRTLILRPGANFRDGERYVVALRRVRDAAGSLIPPGRAFQVYRDRIPTYREPIESRRAHMEELFATLGRAGIARDDLFLAWDFTVISKRNLSERLLHMRDDAFAGLGGAAPAFEVTLVEEDFNAEILRRVSGTFQVPLYLTNDGSPGSRLVFGPDGLPEQVEGSVEYTADFRCIVPRAASADGGEPVTPARLSLYGHGLLGSHTETGASHVRAMASEHNFVFCGTDMIGMAEDDADFDNPPPWVGVIISDLSLFPTLADRLHQGMLNTLFLGRLMKHPDGLSSHAAFQATSGAPLLDVSDLFYDGNSQGAISGGAVSAVAQDWTRAVLGVPGMNYSTLLRRSVDFDTFLLLLSVAYEQGLEHTIAIALIQMLWDRVETSGHANHLTADTYPDTPPKRILLHVAFGDFQVANVTAEVEARSIGAHVREPALGPGKHWEATPFFGIPPIASFPFDGSALVYWDSGNLTPPNGNVPPRALGNTLSACAAAFGGDPHECPRRQPSARLQKSEFLRTGGALVEVCGSEPCLAPSP